MYSTQVVAGGRPRERGTVKLDSSQRNAGNVTLHKCTDSQEQGQPINGEPRLDYDVVCQIGRSAWVLAAAFTLTYTDAKGPYIIP